MNDLSRLTKIVFHMKSTLDGIYSMMEMMMKQQQAQEKKRNQREKKQDPEPEDTLLNSNEVMAMLKISARTFERYKDSKELRPTGPRNKYFLKSEVMKSKKANRS